MKRLPFRLRIALLSALISGTVLVAFGVTAWYLMYLERLAAVDREIRALAYRHPGWIGARANYERLSTVIEMVFGEDRKEQLILLVKDVSGATRYVSSHWPHDLDPDSLNLVLPDAPEPFEPAARSSSTQSNEPIAPPRRGPPWAAGNGSSGSSPRGPGWMRGGGSAPPLFSKTPRFFTRQTAQSTWRIGIFGHEGDRLVIGLNYVGLQSELEQMRNAFLVALPVALLVVGGGGWWIGGRAVRPLRSIARIADRVTARDLGQRIPPSTEDPEIDRLIGGLNGMMDRLEASFRQTSRFTADASHELKTPLAVMQGELENALQSAAVGSREQEVFANLLEETQRLKTITRSLLLLAQADSGHMPLSLARVNLGAELRGLREDVEVLAADLKLQFDLSVPPDACVEADWSLLRQAVLNLLTNAARYNEPGGRIDVVLTAGERTIELDVSNTGPGIPTCDQPRVFDRFFRVDAARSQAVEGVGLGLSLAREIVRAHRGDLELSESRLGHTCFRLTLPAVRGGNLEPPPQDRPLADDLRTRGTP